jgi:hypothetical protein
MRIQSDADHTPQGLDRRRRRSNQDKQRAPGLRGDRGPGYWASRRAIRIPTR